MKSGLTDITIILDRSGSMQSIASDTIGGVNKFLADQRALPGELNVTLVQFDDQDPFEVICKSTPVAQVKDLDKTTFTPRGSTPLLDAIGHGINETGTRLSALPEADRPEHVIFVIMTDGHENASRKFDKNEVMQAITHQRDTYKWQFVFLGANQDAIATAASIGIGANAALTYAANAKGTRATYSSLSSNVQNMRIGGQCVFSSDDRQSATGN